MVYDSVILSNWKAPPVCLDLNKGHSQREVKVNGDIKASWLLTGCPLAGDGNHPAAACLPVHLGGEHSLALVWLSLTSKITGFAWCVYVMT